MATNAEKTQAALQLLLKESKQQHDLLNDLCSAELGQSHLLDAWTNNDTNKLRQLGAQLEKLDAAYPGGLRQYIAKARKLLESESIISI